MAADIHSPLDRVLDPVARCLTPDAARRVASLVPDQNTQARINELAAKANEGLLTPAERAEYVGYVEAIDVVSILQAKARKILAASGA